VKTKSPFKLAMPTFVQSVFLYINYLSAHFFFFIKNVTAYPY